MKIKGYRVSVGSMFSKVPEAFFPWIALVGYFLDFAWNVQENFLQKCGQEIFLHSSKCQPHSYSNLVDTWADSVCIHQLSMFSTSARSIFPMDGTCGLFFGLRMECVGRFPTKMRSYDLFLPASRTQSTWPAGPKIALCFPRLQVYIYIYLFVHPHLSRAQ